MPTGVSQPDIKYVFADDKLTLYINSDIGHGKLEGGAQHKSPANRPEIYFTSDDATGHGYSYNGLQIENWYETASLGSAGKGNTASFTATYDGGDQTSGGGIIDAYSYPVATGFTAPICDSCVANQYTGHPVRYFDGAAKMTFGDFIPSGASSFTLGRSWSNKSYSSDQQVSSFGNGMSMGSLSYLQDLSGQVDNSHDDGSSTKPSAFAVVESSTSAYAVFRTYDGSYDNSADGATGKITFTDGTNTIIETDPDGTVSTYADFGSHWGEKEKGQLLSRTRPGGDELTLTWDAVNDRPSFYTQTSTDASGNPLTDTFDFSYAAGSDDQVTRVIQSRNGAAIRTVDYDYYGTGDGNGASGDIQYVTTRNGDATSPVVSRNYYRWYTADTFDSGGQQIGYAGGLKLYMADEGYQKALHDVGIADGSGETTLAGVSDATLTNYADNCFEYDNAHRVTKEIAMGAGTGCSCGNTGEGTYTFSYDANPSPGSGNNAWRMRTTVGMPDGSQQIVYTNGSGATVLKVVNDVANSKTYSTWYQYDDNGNIIKQAEGKAIAAYDPSDSSSVASFEQYADLVGYGQGAPGHLGANLSGVGKIVATNYFKTADGFDPSLVNYEQSIGFINASTGAFTETESWEYEDGGVTGDGIWNVATDTTYPDATNPAVTRTTSYTYNSWWQTGGVNSTQPKQITTTLAAVSTSENGSGTSNTTQAIYDSAGRVVWYVDGSGYINYFEYDPLTGAKTKEVDDVDPSTITTATVAGPARANTLPAALNLTTTIVVDSQGRTTKVTDPNGNVTYTVYDDTTDDGDPRKVITYTGWNATTHQPTGPVWATIDDPATGTKDTVSYAYAAAGGLPVDANGVPTGAEWSAANVANLTIQSLVRQKRNVSDQVVEEDTYTNLNGLTYDPSDSAGWATLGTVGTNYLATKYKYDGGARLYQTTTPDGTITMRVYDARGFVQSVWKGTDNTAATDTDPTGGGATGNNMVEIDSYTYDDDGNQLTMSQHADTSTVYKTTYQYDFRDRLTDARGPDGVATHFVINNLREQTETDTYADSNGNFVEDPGEEIGKSTDAYDDQGRVYRSSVYQNSRALDTGALTSTGTTATVKLANHGFSSGQSVTIAGASQSTYDGTFTITVVDANTFTFTMPASTTSPATGSRITVTANKSLITNYWYDARGNQVKTQDPKGLITKMFYDGAGRLYQTDTSADATETASGSYADALTLTGDQVIEEFDYYLDHGGRTRIVTDWKRDGSQYFTGTGQPYDTSNYDHNSTAYYYDAANRLIATANFGRDGTESGSSAADHLVIKQYTHSYVDVNANGIPDVIDHADGFDPGLSNSTSQTSYEWIYTGYSYDAAGRQQFVTDNAGRKTQTLYDLAGRTTATIANYTGDGSVTETTPGDQNQTTRYVYDSQGRLSQQIALNANGSGNSVESQKTVYTYGDPTDSSLVTETDYPGFGILVIIEPLPGQQPGDSFSFHPDATLNSYDRLGRVTTMTSHRELESDNTLLGIVHTYTYDSAGRLSTDSIGTGTLPKGVDGTVRTIQYTYDDQSRVSTVSSLNASGAVVNQVAYTYDAWGNVTKDAEEHSGAVTASTPAVNYYYDDGSGTGTAARYVRINKVLYPKNNGTSVGTFTYSYESWATGAALSRIQYIRDGNGLQLVQYQWLGADTLTNTILHPQVSGGLTMNDGSSGSHYLNLDRYYRQKAVQWQSLNGSTQFQQVLYTYDRTGNVLTKDNNSAGTGAGNWDETYAYDGLNRLVDYKRGSLSGGTISGSNLKFEQTWSLDALGNWVGYTQTNNDTSLPSNFTTFSQTRTVDAANEITSTTGGGFASTAYDASGNQTAGPKTGAESTQLGYVYDGWNRLVGVDANHDGDLYDAGDVRYSYDGTGRRITKFTDSTDDSTNNAGSTEEYYQNEQDQVLEVRIGTVTAGVKTVNANPKERYLWDLNYVDAPAMVELDTNTDGTRDYRLWPTWDANHNVTSLVTDGGKTVERYEYTPYGQQIILNGSSNYAGTGADADGADWSVDTNGSDYGFLIGYQGLRLNPETGDWETDSRITNPNFGFIQRDPMGYADSMNLYQLEGGDPVTGNDPSGMTQYIVPGSSYGGGNAGGMVQVPRNQGPGQSMNPPGVGGNGLVADRAPATQPSSAGHRIGSAIGGGFGLAGGIIIGAVGGTVVEPGGGTVAGGVEGGIEGEVGGEIAGGLIGDIIDTLINKLTKAEPAPCPTGKCKPCSPPVGTKMQRTDPVPPSKPHYPYPGTHTHIYVVNQRPFPDCGCFLNKADPPDMDGVGPYGPVVEPTGGGPAL